MGLFTTEALVLKHFDLGEADKIITFYTRNYGKVRAVARGVRKTKNSMSGLVLPFSYNRVTFYKGRSLNRINKIESIFSFASLRNNLTRWAYASYMAEFTERVGMEEDPNQDLFALLLASYRELNQLKENVDSNLDLVFKIRLLSVLGFGPELWECLGCHQEVKVGQKNALSIPEGGVLCPDCHPESVSQISGEGLQVLRKVVKSGLKPVGKLKISRKATKELDQFLDSYIQYHLEIKLKSANFLHMIKGMG